GGEVEPRRVGVADVKRRCVDACGIYGAVVGRVEGRGAVARARTRGAWVLKHRVRRVEAGFGEDPVDRSLDQGVTEVGVRARAAALIGVGLIEPARLTRALADGALEADVVVENPSQVDEAEQEQDEDEGRGPEFDRRLTAPSCRVSRQGYGPPRRKCIASRAAGPSRMTQSVGKMHPSIGRSIFNEAFAPRSCAVTNRRRRISSDWMRRIRLMPDPSCSAWMIAWTKLFRSSTPVRRPMSFSASSRGRP